MPVTAGLGRLQLRLFAPLLGPPRPGGGLSLRRWHPGGRRGATTGETTGKLRGNHVENVGKPREKCGLMRCFYIFFFHGKSLGKSMGKVWNMEISPVSIGIWPRRSAVLPARDNLTKLQGIMVVSNKKRGLTSKTRAVTNKRGTLYPKKCWLETVANIGQMSLIHITWGNWGQTKHKPCNIFLLNCINWWTYTS